MQSDKFVKVLLFSDKSIYIVTPVIVKKETFFSCMFIKSVLNKFRINFLFHLKIGWNIDTSGNIILFPNARIFREGCKKKKIVEFSTKLGG